MAEHQPDTRTWEERLEAQAITATELLTLSWSAVTAIVRAYWSKHNKGLAGWEEAGDVLNLVGEKLYAKLQKQMPTDVKRYKGLVWLVAKDVVCEERRKQNADASGRTGNLSVDPVDGSDDPLSALTKDEPYAAELRTAFGEALALNFGYLTQKQLDVFHLRTMEQLTREEQAAALGISPHTIPDHIEGIVRNIQRVWATGKFPTPDLTGVFCRYAQTRADVVGLFQVYLNILTSIKNQMENTTGLSITEAYDRKLPLGVPLDLKPGVEPWPELILYQHLCTGRHGQLWRARFEKAYVAVKILMTPDRVGHWEEVYAATVAMGFQHPHVLKTFGVIYGPLPYMMIMSELGGYSLLAVLDKAKRDGDRDIRVDLLTYVMRQAALGLDYINNCGFVHGDIRLGNLLIIDNKLKIGNFGTLSTITSPVSNGSGDTHDLLRPPEFRQGYKAKSSDEYSLAAICYLLRTCFRSGKEDPSLLSDEEYRVYAKALHADPDERYGSCAQFVENLSYALRDTLPAALVGPVVQPSKELLQLPSEEDLRTQYAELSTAKLRSILRELNDPVRRWREPEEVRTNPRKYKHAVIALVKEELAKRSD